MSYPAYKQDKRDRKRKKMKKIIPAILTNEKRELQEKLEFLRGLVDWVQIDVIDGKFVQNKTVSLKEVAPFSSLFSIEAHLMVLSPEIFFKECKESGVKRVVFHIEGIENPSKVLQELGKYNLQKGIALSPETPVERVKPYLDCLDVVLLLSVHPGFSGQKFITETLNKIKEIKRIAKNQLIGVDGGINIENIEAVAKSGADYMVIGKSLFASGNVKETLAALQRKIKNL